MYVLFQVRRRQPRDLPRVLQADGVLHPAAQHQTLLREGGGAARGAAEDPRDALCGAQRWRGHTGLRGRYQVSFQMRLYLA